MNRGVRGLLALVFVLAAAAPVRAAEPAVTMQAVAGFDGKAKAGQWAPVTVTIQNDGPELAGTIRFEVDAAMGGGGPLHHTGVYETQVAVPAGAAKRVEIDVPDLAAASALELVAGGKTVASAAVQVDFSNELLVGVLGVEPAELPALAGQTLAGRPVRLLRLDPAALPADAVLLENLDAVLIDRFAYSELPAPQRESLQAWVEHGGTLIAAAGPEAKRLDGMAPWVELPLSGVATAAIPGVGQAALSQVTAVHAGWEVEGRIGEQTVALRTARGLGAVHLLTFDPALEPFASWQGLAGMLAPMLPAPADGILAMGKGGMAPVQMKANLALVDGLNQFPMRELPSTKGLLILLGAYALLIGPVQFLLLRGFKRLGWALLTLPVLAGAGSAGAWAYTAHARGSDLLVNAVAVLEGQSGSKSLRVHGMTGFFVPPSSAHRVSVGDALLAPVASGMVVKLGPDGLPPSQQTGFQGARQADLDKVDIWGMHALSAEAMVPVSGTVDGALVMDTAGLTGRLTSHLPFRLEDALVASGTSFTPLGDLNPGDAVDVALMAPAFAQQFGGDNPLAEVLSRANQFTGGPNPSPDDYLQMRRQQLAWAAAQTVSWARSVHQPWAVLVGWTDYQALPVTIDGKPGNADSLTLYVQPLPVGLSAAAFAVPASLLPGRMVEYGGAAQAGVLQTGWNLAQGESVVVDFDIPAAAQGRVTGVAVEVPAMGGLPNGKYPLAYSFYRWSDGTWQPAAVEIDKASPGADPAFISPSGTVRVKLTQTIPERVPLGAPGLAVTGRGVKP